MPLITTRPASPQAERPHRRARERSGPQDGGVEDHIWNRLAIRMASSSESYAITLSTGPKISSPRYRHVVRHVHRTPLASGRSSPLRGPGGWPSPPTDAPERLLQCLCGCRIVCASYCFCDTIGPTAVLGSAGSPTGKGRPWRLTMARLAASKSLKLGNNSSRCPLRRRLDRCSGNAIPSARGNRRFEALALIKQDCGRFAPQLSRW